MSIHRRGHPLPPRRHSRRAAVLIRVLRRAAAALPLGLRLLLLRNPTALHRQAILGPEPLGASYTAWNHPFLPAESLGVPSLVDGEGFPTHAGLRPPSAAQGRASLLAVADGAAPVVGREIRLTFATTRSTSVAAAASRAPSVVDRKVLSADAASRTLSVVDNELRPHRVASGTPSAVSSAAALARASPGVCNELESAITAPRTPSVVARALLPLAVTAPRTDPNLGRQVV